MPFPLKGVSDPKTDHYSKTDIPFYMNSQALILALAVNKLRLKQSQFIAK